MYSPASRFTVKLACSIDIVLNLNRLSCFNKLYSKRSDPVFYFPFKPGANIDRDILSIRQ